MSGSISNCCWSHKVRQERRSRPSSTCCGAKLSLTQCLVVQSAISARCEMHSLNLSHTAQNQRQSSPALHGKDGWLACRAEARPFQRKMAGTSLNLLLQAPLECLHRDRNSSRCTQVIAPAEDQGRSAKGPLGVCRRVLQLRLPQHQRMLCCSSAAPPVSRHQAM